MREELIQSLFLENKWKRKVWSHFPEEKVDKMRVSIIGKHNFTFIDINVSALNHLYFEILKLFL